MTKKKDDEDFEDSTKCSICDNVIMVMMIQLMCLKNLEIVA